MSSVKVIYKSKNQVSLFKIMLIFVGMTIGVLIFAISDDDGYLFLMPGTRAINGFGNTVYEEAKELLGLDEVPDTGGSTVATTGKGLNLLLINNISTECFVKEYLSICAENQNGTLDTTTRERYVELETILGINVAETGFYKNTFLPYAGLPDTGSGPKWDNSTYSLKNWNVNSIYLNPATKQGGPFQYISAGNLTKIGTKSIYNTGTSTAGGVGDCYLFPDAITGLNDYLAGACANVGIDITKPNAKEAATICVIAHNRGDAGALGYIGGIQYSKGRNYSTYLTKDSDTFADSLSEITTDFNTFDENTDVYDLMSTMYFKPDYWYVYLQLYSCGWNMSKSAYNYIAGVSNGTAMVNVWNKLYPNDPVSSKADVLSKIKPMAKDLSEVTGYSASDCDRIYGTTNGAYSMAGSGYGWQERGYLFKVTDREGSIYNQKLSDGSNPKIVYCLDALCAMHITSASVCGQYIYAYMLKYAGVDVDPTEPSSYLSNLSQQDEWIPAGSWINDYSIDVSALSENRIKLLNAAYNLIDIPYSQELRDEQDMAKRPSYLDCSAFAWRAYADAGITKNLPTTTFGYAGSSSVRRIPWSELRPGDLVCRNNGSHGHVEMYLGYDSDTNMIIIIGAHQPGKNSSIVYSDTSNFNRTDDITSTSANLLNAYRVVALDSE